MRISYLLMGAWLFATPLFSETLDQLTRFTLTEDTAAVTRLLGPPAQIAEAGPSHFSWLFQTDVLDNHDHSHILLFAKRSGTLVSVTRNFHEAVNVDALFPAGTRTHYYVAPNQPRWPVRVRLLPGDRVLIAMGVAKPGEGTTQLLLIRREALAEYLLWVAEQLTDK
jgi:hypothetical protein